MPYSISEMKRLLSDGEIGTILSKLPSPETNNGKDLVSFLKYDFFFKPLSSITSKNPNITSKDELNQLYRRIYEQIKQLNPRQQASVLQVIAGHYLNAVMQLGNDLFSDVLDLCQKHNVLQTVLIQAFGQDINFNNKNLDEDNVGQVRQLWELASQETKESISQNHRRMYLFMLWLCKVDQAFARDVLNDCQPELLEYGFIECLDTIAREDFEGVYQVFHALQDEAQQKQLVSACDAIVIDQLLENDPQWERSSSFLLEGMSDEVFMHLLAENGKTILVSAGAKEPDSYEIADQGYEDVFVNNILKRMLSLAGKEQNANQYYEQLRRIVNNSWFEKTIFNLFNPASCDESQLQTLVWFICQADPKVRASFLKNTLKVDRPTLAYALLSQNSLLLDPQVAFEEVFANNNINGAIRAFNQLTDQEQRDYLLNWSKNERSHQQHLNPIFCNTDVFKLLVNIDQEIKCFINPSWYRRRHLTYFDNKYSDQQLATMNTVFDNSKHYYNDSGQIHLAQGLIAIYMSGNLFPSDDSDDTVYLDITKIEQDFKQACEHFNEAVLKNPDITAVINNILWQATMQVEALRVEERPDGPETRDEMKEDAPITIKQCVKDKLQELSSPLNPQPLVDSATAVYFSYPVNTISFFSSKEIDGTQASYSLDQVGAGEDGFYPYNGPN